MWFIALCYLIVAFIWRFASLGLKRLLGFSVVLFHASTWGLWLFMQGSVTPTASTSFGIAALVCSVLLLLPRQKEDDRAIQPAGFLVSSMLVFFWWLTMPTSASATSWNLWKSIAFFLTDVGVGCMLFSGLLAWSVMADGAGQKGFYIERLRKSQKLTVALFALSLLVHFFWGWGGSSHQLISAGAFLLVFHVTLLPQTRVFQDQNKRTQLAPSRLYLLWSASISTFALSWLFFQLLTSVSSNA